MDSGKEDFFIRDPNDANLYESVDLNKEAPSSFEAALATRNGGEPIEWIPEAENIKQFIRENKHIGVISPFPENEGIFVGYHKILILMVDLETRGLVKRVIYATPEQVKLGKFIAPIEGLFAMNVLE